MYQQYGFIVEYWYYYYCIVIMVDQVFEMVMFIVGEFQVQMLVLEGVVFFIGDLMDDW